MFELLICFIFFSLLFKTIGLTFRLTWGLAKFIASLLMILALPVLIIVVLFASGIFLFLPLILIGIAAGIVKSCVKV
ncbi:MAG: hypothetical protein IKT45_09400 [Lachnospiraceae bacterium]|nr:hypothetical protein [Lachnospiraceae bacterium]